MNKLIKASILSIAMALLPLQFELKANDDVVIKHLGKDNIIFRDGSYIQNSLVHVAKPGNFLLLPVQDNSDEAKVKVLVNGKIDRTITVRLAKTKVDYLFPLDLRPYEGKDVVLNIEMNQNRSSMRDPGEEACWEKFAVVNQVDSSNIEKYRPLFHHTPLYGWMNDPNGMFYKDGRWHLYYQWNPYGSKWQNLSWGHSSSTDLVNWEHHPIALEPDGLGMIFSGSCAIDHNNTAGLGKDAVIAIYTSADLNQVQSFASSNDNGKTFEVFGANPIIATDTEARDPNFFFHEPTGKWILVLANALNHEMLIFSSPDMKNWTLESSFGKGLGAQNGVWECPDLFELPVNGTNEKKWMLICNLNPGGLYGGSGIQYFIGDFDGKTFTPDIDQNGKVPTKWLDFGKDNYAGVSWSDAPDNRRAYIGWMSNWQYAAEVPTKQYRSANTLPREISLFRHSDGQIYAATLPSPEILSIREKASQSLKDFTIGEKPRLISLPKENDGICEIVVDMDSHNNCDIVLELQNNKGDRTTMTYDPARHTFEVNRRHSGDTSFSVDFPAITSAPTFERDGKLGLRIFI
ncbi:MAG: DUF4980 domain-containing protein, partial [Muribaculaceae bacterium]|nr:DUF4980 domain-containing protein [Muribaculaceae bacterium]